MNSELPLADDEEEADPELDGNENVGSFVVDSLVVVVVVGWVEPTFAKLKPDEKGFVDDAIVWLELVEGVEVVAGVVVVVVDDDDGDGNLKPDGVVVKLNGASVPPLVPSVSEGGGCAGVDVEVVDKPDTGEELDSLKMD